MSQDDTMNLSRDEAMRRLRDIEATEKQSQTVYGYQKASPHLILWGLIWAVGYANSDLNPRGGGVGWMMLVTAGSIGSFAIGRRTRDLPRQGGFAAWRFGAVWAAVGAFFTAIFAVLGPVSSKQVGATIPLVLALAYVIVGLWAGARFVVAGVVVAALTLGGYFWLAEHFGVWMALVGGGALILAGLWMRKV